MSSSSSNPKAPVELYMTDFCPFAQRAWIAFLEKEDDPNNPKLFNYKEVNYYGRELPLTKEFLKLHNTVPAGYDAQGNELRESMPMVYWIEEQWPSKNPLMPADAEGQARVKSLISKFTSGEFDITGSTFRLLTEHDSAKSDALWTALQRAYAELGKEVASSGGPFLLGNQFTVADIALYPFVEKAYINLAHYKSLATPEIADFAPFHAWVRSVESRPSVAITIADRLPRSIAVQPFAARRRAEYIAETSEGMLHGVKDIFRKQLLHAPAGVASTDLVKAIRQRDADKAKEAAAAKA